MKASLKDLAGRSAASGPASATVAAPEPGEGVAGYRRAQTRNDTRQVSGHFKAEVSQTLRLIAVEQDRDVQEIMAEGLNMVFERYGKATRAEVTSGRRKKSAGP